MDYLTNPISRKQLRQLASIFRGMFGLSSKKPVPVIDLLDRFCSIIPGVDYEIVENNELEYGTPAQAVMHTDNSFVIKIKEYVYEGALTKNIGGSRNHIMHEMCHVFLYKIGFGPILDRAFKNNEIEPCRSAEWQAKALCGEIMIPYEETFNMTAEEIARTYNVSMESAKYRLTY